MKNSMWSKLALMSVLSFVAMYVLMYMMVDMYGNVFASINQFYMAATMTAAMVIIELVVMSSMYPEERKKMIVIGVSALVLVVSITGTRQQIAISDKDFLRSMISHHGAAILMCKNSNLKDPEIKALCASITSGQQSEIDFMKSKLQGQNN